MKEKLLLDRQEEIEREKQREREFNDRIRQEIVNLKLQQRVERQEEERLQRMHWNFERDQKMEEIVRKKLELEKLQENEQYTKKLIDRRQVEVEEIKEEKLIRDGESAQLLQKALKHANAIQELIESGVLDNEFQANLVQVLAGNKENEENKRLREEMLEEIVARMEQRKEEN